MSRFRALTFLVMLSAFLYGVVDPLPTWAQGADSEISARIRMLEEGKAGQVKAELAALVAKYQNHPGVLYLQGRLAVNGVEAAKLYMSIMDNFPRSEWADDALYRIYLFYSSLGLVRTAGLKMLQLQQDYPNSPYGRKPVAQVFDDKQPPSNIILPGGEPRDTSTLIPTPRIIQTPVQPPSGSYAIQVGAFSSIDNAKRLKAFFEELGYGVELQNKVRGGRSLYLVWVGNFKTSAEAKKFGVELKEKHKMESIVVAR